MDILLKLDQNPVYPTAFSVEGLDIGVATVPGPLLSDSIRIVRKNGLTWQFDNADSKRELPSNIRARMDTPLYERHNLQVDTPQAFHGLLRSLGGCINII